MPTPVPAPILNLPPAWGYRREVSIAAKPLRLGDSYTLFSTSGPRPLVEQVSIASPARSNKEVFPVINLLRSLEGVREFQWSPSNQARRDYVCESWRATPAGVGLTRFAATFDRWNGLAPTAISQPNPPEIDLTLNWETTIEETAIVNERRIGEGVDRRAALFKNPIQRSFTIRLIIQNEPEIDLFLSNLYGQPFKLKSINHKLPDMQNMLFNCTKWTFEGMPQGLSRFEAQFNQVRRP